jgi:amidophosphoribosyltransferase
MDTGTRGELIAADLTVSEVRDYLGCDTLAYLDLDRLVTATGVASKGFCAACLTGDYPVPVPAARVADEDLPSVDLVHPSG